MSSPDPWLVLGLPPGSSLAAARAARRRLAKQLHPDLHPGQADRSARMTLVNEALAEIESSWGKGRSVAPAGAAAPIKRDATSLWPATAARPQPAHACGPSDPDRLSVECLPVVAFEALFLAAYGLGDILVAEEPYLLELYLNQPYPCFCRLTLAPQAGGSLVTVKVTPAFESEPNPGSADVIETLVAELNALGAG